MRKMTIGIILVAVLAVLFLDLCTFVAKPYQTVLLNRFGKIITNPTKICYHWYLRWPTDDVIRMDNRLHLYQSNNREVSTASGAGEPITIRTWAAWRITNPKQYYIHFPGGSTVMKNFLDNKIQGVVLSVMGNYRLHQIFNTDPKQIETPEIEHQMLTQVNAMIAHRWGIKLVAIGISRMTFPPRVAEAVYNRMSREREKIASRYRNEGMSEATAIVAQGQEQATEIRSEAEKTAEELRGDGDAKAYAVLNRAQRTPAARRFYRFWKSLQLFKNSMGSSTYWVLTPNNPITAPLFHQMQEAGTADTTRKPASAAPEKK